MNWPQRKIDQLDEIVMLCCCWCNSSSLIRRLAKNMLSLFLLWADLGLFYVLLKHIFYKKCISWTAKITAFGKIICTKNLLQYWTRENNFETGETTKFCKNRLIFFWSSTAKLLNTKGFFKWAIPNLFLVILVFSTANN